MNALVQKAEYLFDLGRYREVLETCNKALASDPDDARAAYLAGLASLCLEDIDSAERFARSLIGAHAHLPYGCEVMAQVKAIRGDDTSADRLYRDALKLAPDSGHLFGLLAHHLGQRGRLEEAITVARRGIKQEPENPSLLQLLSSLYRRNEELDFAEEFAQRALRANPEDGDGHLEAAMLLLATGKRGEANARFRESFRLGNVEGDTMETVAHERVRSHWFFKKGWFLPTERPAVIVILATPLVWFMLGLLFRPFLWIGALAVVLLAVGYAYVGLFSLCCRIVLRRIRRGGA